MNLFASSNQKLVIKQGFKKAQKEIDMSFVGMYIAHDGIVVSADSLMRTSCGDGTFIDSYGNKVFSVLGGSAVVAITGQMTFGNKRISFSKIVNIINNKSTSISEFISLLMELLKKEEVVSHTVIWIAGYEKGNLGFCTITGRCKDVEMGEADRWEQLYPANILPLYFSGAHWAIHYAESCKLPTKHVAEAKDSLQTLVKLICKVDKELRYIDNTVGGEVKTIVVLPPTK